MNNSQCLVAADCFSYLVINRICRNLIQPVPEFRAAAIELVKMFDNVEKNLSSDILSDMAVKCPVYTVAKHCIVVPTVEGRERRRVRTGIVNQLATITMTAKDYESVKLPAGNQDLLRIDTQLRFAGGQVLEGSMWTDRKGDALKSRIVALNMEKVRATKELALKDHQMLLDMGSPLAAELEYVVVNGREKEPEQFFGVSTSVN